MLVNDKFLLSQPFDLTTTLLPSLDGISRYFLFISISFLKNLPASSYESELVILSHVSVNCQDTTQADFSRIFFKQFFTSYLKFVLLISPPCLSLNLTLVISVFMKEKFDRSSIPNRIFFTSSNKT
jgi:hypothetical protein